MRLGTIDPGKHKCAWAYWVGRKLVCAGYSERPPYYEADKLIVEVPRVYPRTTPEPNDLIDLAMAAGFFAGAWGSIETVHVHPRQWKGTVRKDIMLKRIEARLSAREKGILDAAVPQKSLRHNVVDAIGIGLWHFKRLEK